MKPIWRNKPQAKNPSYTIITEEKGVPVANSGDDEVIASLLNHPGFVALCNRFKLKRQALLAQLEGTRHKEIRDVDFIQSGLYWLRFAESEVNTATRNLRIGAQRKAAPEEVIEFNKVLSAIESVRDNA